MGIVKVHPYSNTWELRVTQIYGPRPPSWFMFGTPVRKGDGLYLELSSKVKYFCPETGETLIVPKSTVTEVPLDPIDKKGERATFSPGGNESSCVNRWCEIYIERDKLIAFDNKKECDLVSYSKLHYHLLKSLFPSFPSPEVIDAEVRRIGCLETSKKLFLMSCR